MCQDSHSKDDLFNPQLQALVFDSPFEPSDRALISYVPASSSSSR